MPVLEEIFLGGRATGGLISAAVIEGGVVCVALTIFVVKPVQREFSSILELPTLDVGGKMAFAYGSLVDLLS